jgi:hypothetical protein
MTESEHGGKMCEKIRADRKDSSRQRYERMKAMRYGVFGGVYGMAFIGAAIYFIQHAASFWSGVFAFFKALFWPAVTDVQVAGDPENVVSCLGCESRFGTCLDRADSLMASHPWLKNSSRAAKAGKNRKRRRKKSTIDSKSCSDIRRLGNLDFLSLIN